MIFISSLFLVMRAAAKLATMDLSSKPTTLPNPQNSAVADSTYPDVKLFDITVPHFKFRGPVLFGVGNIYKRSPAAQKSEVMTDTIGRRLTKLTVRLKTFLADGELDVRGFESLHERTKMEVNDIVQEFEGYRKGRGDVYGSSFSAHRFRALQFQYDFVLRFFAAFSNALGKWKKFCRHRRPGSDLLWKVIEAEVWLYALYTTYGTPDMCLFPDSSEFIDYVRDLELSVKLWNDSFGKTFLVSPAIRREFAIALPRAQAAIALLEWAIKR